MPQSMPQSMPQHPTSSRSPFSVPSAVPEFQFRSAALLHISWQCKFLATRPTPKLEDYPLSAVRDCLFNMFVATLHIGGHSSIRNPRTRHAVVTGTHLSRTVSSIPEEMPKYNRPAWWRKGNNTNISITCQESSNLSGGNFECWQLSNTTAGKFSNTLNWTVSIPLCIYTTFFH
jgi:hypothetical protein